MITINSIPPGGIELKDTGKEITVKNLNVFTVLTHSKGKLLEIPIELEFLEYKDWHLAIGMFENLEEKLAENGWRLVGISGNKRQFARIPDKNEYWEPEQFKEFKDKVDLLSKDGHYERNKCCNLMRISPCVCHVSYHCPIHGDKCFGSHD